MLLKWKYDANSVTALETRDSATLTPTHCSGVEATAHLLYAQQPHSHHHNRLRALRCNSCIGHSDRQETGRDVNMWTLALSLLLLGTVSCEVVTFRNCPVSGKLTK
jgi:hypothetical protein